MDTVILILSVIWLLVVVPFLLFFFIRGLRRLRFSLRTLMIIALGGGFWASLLKRLKGSDLFELGLIMSLTFLVALFEYILIQGANPAVKTLDQRPEGREA